MKCKVLVVEDMQDLLDRYVKYLLDAGFEVKGVNNGEDALETLDVFFPDIIIIDVALDNKSRKTLYPDGRSLCRLIRNREAYRSHTSKFIVMISAKYTLPGDVAIGTEYYGADFYPARKPESREEIVAMVRSLARILAIGEPVAKPKGDSDWLVVDNCMAIYRHLPEIKICDKVRRIARTQHLILWRLHDHFGKPCSNFDLADWAGISPARVAVEIREIRKIIDELLDPDLTGRKYIDNVRGEGYVLRQPTV